MNCIYSFHFDLILYFVVKSILQLKRSQINQCISCAILTPAHNTTNSLKEKKMSSIQFSLNRTMRAINHIILKHIAHNSVSLNDRFFSIFEMSFVYISQTKTI